MCAENAKPKADNTSTVAISPREKWASRLEQAAFLILIIAAASRPLVSETYRSSIHSIAQAVGTSDQITPAVTAVFVGILWLAGLALAVSRWLERKPWLLTGIEPGLVLLIIGATISSMVASNHRLAINASVDWLTCLFAILTVANFRRLKGWRYLLLAAIVASGLVSSAKSISQVMFEYPETWELYQQSREDFWASQNIALDEPTVSLFEARMKSREATGFLPYSNIQAALLGLTGFAALALAEFMGRFRWGKWSCRLLAALLLGSIWLTGSAGGTVAAGIGVAIWLTRQHWLLWFRRAWRKALVAVWGLAVVAIVAVVLFGSARGSLPSDSLRFRWNYWEVTASILNDHVMTGVGALNFDRAYLQHKPVDFPEEINDPHSFLLAVASQWGIIGLAGALAALAGGSVSLAKSLREDPQEDTPSYPGVARQWKWGWALAVIPVFLFCRLWLLSGYLNLGRQGKSMVIYEMGTFGFLWALCLATLISIHPQEPSRRSSSWLIAVLAGVAAFLIHNLISFSLFIPATLTLLAVLAGLGFSHRPMTSRNRWQLPAWSMVAIQLAGLTAVTTLMIGPVLQSSFHMRMARQFSEQAAERPELAAEVGSIYYLKAASVDQLDPTPLIEHARLLTRLNQSPASLTRSIELLEKALARDPGNRTIHQNLAEVLRMRAKVSGNPADLLRALGFAESALALYPNSPNAHLMVADLHVDLAAAADTSADRAHHQAAALDHYNQAIALEDQKPASELRRWPVRVRDRVEQVRDSLSRTVSESASPQ